MSTIPLEPPLSPHEIAANTLVSTVRNLVLAALPSFALAAKGRRLKINTTASLSDAFFETVAAACAAHSDLASAGQITATEVRDVIVISRVFGSVAEEFRIIARGIDDTVAELRNSVGQRGRRVYQTARGINRFEERELLIPHLSAMQRTLNRGRTAAKRIAAKAAAAATAAATAAAPVTPTSTPPAAPAAPVGPPAVTPKKEGSSS